MNHTKNKKTPQPTTTFYQKINIFLGKYTWYILGVSLVLFILFGILLFNPFINEAGDDTSYIEGAYAVLYQNTFPSFQGSLYPFVLSILILAFGVDVVILKAFSLICLTLSVGLLFRSLHKHVDPVLNIFVLLMSTFSGATLFYGSQTFNEAFYMMVQSISCLLFIKYYAGEDSEQNKWSKKISIALWVTLWIFLAGITKTVGIVFLPAAIITLLLFRRWKDSILTFSAFALYYLIFAGIKNLVWGIDFLKSDNSQAHALMQKNPYNAGDGMEDFSGYLTRLVENANLFISKYFYNFSHLRENTEAVQPLALLTIFTIVIWIFSLYQGVVKKNKTIVFLALYAGFFMGVTFVALQTFWRQDRLLLPVFPIILLLFWHAIKELTKFEKRWYSAITGLIVMMALIFISFTDVVKKTQEPKFRKHQKAYFKGNRVSSYTNDWKNFLLMSEWSANNTPDTVKIASRKGSMSNIFSGKFKFYGIYAVPPIKIDSIPPPPRHVNTRNHDPPSCQFIYTTIYKIFRGDFSCQRKYAFRRRVANALGIILSPKIT